MLTKFFLMLAEAVLPRSYYVQCEPLLLNNMIGETCFSDFRVEAKTFNSRLHGNRYRPMRDVNRLLLLRLALRMVSELNLGYYAEVGTYEGVSAKIIYNYMDPKSSLYCFDTFEGFPEAVVSLEKEKTGICVSSKDFSQTSIEKVKQYISGNTISENLILKKGVFPDSFFGLENFMWRFTHLDCDLYETIKCGLESFWPSMVVNGIIVVHDYNSKFEGVKIAVDEFCKLNNAILIPWVDFCGSAMIIKK